MDPWSIDVVLGYLLSRGVLHTIPECFQDNLHFIDCAASHSMAQVRFFVVSPLFFVVQVNGFGVSWHLVELTLVQGGPIHNS
jgi:hypothetical protein